MSNENEPVEPASLPVDVTLEDARSAYAAAQLESSMLRAKLASMTAERDDLIAEFEKVKYIVKENSDLRMTQRPLIEAIGAEVVKKLNERDARMERAANDRRKWQEEQDAYRAAQAASVDAGGEPNG